MKKFYIRRAASPEGDGGGRQAGQKAGAHGGGGCGIRGGRGGQGGDEAAGQGGLRRGQKVQKIIPPFCKVMMIVSGAVAVLSCVGWLISRKKFA